MTDARTRSRAHGRGTASCGDRPGGSTATYRLHVRSDEFSYEHEVHATRVDREDGWTVFRADDDVSMRVRDEHIVSLEHLV